MKRGELEHVEEMMIDVVKKKKIPVKTVLMDSWYATIKRNGFNR